MASLRQDNRGNYVSRKKLPVDVRDEYGRLFGQRHEAKFFRPASTDRREAQRQFSEWSAEVDGNIIAIRAVFRALNDDFEGRSAGAIQPEEAEAWVRKRVTANAPTNALARKRSRTAETVKNTTVKAVNTVFRWGVNKKHLASNPFEHAADALTVSKRPKLRDTQAFTPEERSKILSAASATKAFRKRDDAARRWVPWLCAYTGARVGEITQLRKGDVIKRAAFTR